MSFDGPTVQTSNQERRRINKPSVIILLVVLALFIAYALYVILASN